MAQPHTVIPAELVTTAHLVLRRPRLSDADDIFDNYASDPEVTRYLTWRPYKTPGEIAPFLTSCLERWDSGEEYSWTITLPTDTRVIGMIGCRVRGHAADIGYVLGRKYWGRGYVSEAAQAVTTWAIGLESVYRVWAVCDLDNKASGRVLEKIGMQCEGILRRYIIHPNILPDPRDCYIYAKVR